MSYNIHVKADNKDEILKIRESLIKKFGDQFDFDTDRIYERNGFFNASWPKKPTCDISIGVKEVSKEFPNNRFTVIRVGLEDADIVQDHEVIYDGECTDSTSYC